MSNTLLISNWNQLVKARSENYSNLRIVVTEYNSDDLKGTKVSIVDYNTNDVYFSSFAVNIDGSLIPRGAQLEPQAIIYCINSYGFNVGLSQPINLTQNVITILQGLYNAGYRYIYKDYPRKYNNHLSRNKSLYLIMASKLIEKRTDGILVTDFPDFIEDEWDWCVPFTTYPIIDLIETKQSSANMVCITQGNRFLIDITPIDSTTGTAIRLEDNDYVLFTVKDSVGNIVIQKRLTNQDYTDPEDTSLNCILEPADTENLSAGIYKYDCLLVTVSGDATTFISSVLRIDEALGKI